jgi:hypothetical protein
MDIILSVPLVLPDEPLDLAELETRVQAWGQEVMRAGMACAWAEQAALRSPQPCPTCASTALHPAGTKPRQVETLFGPVTLPRRRVCCGGCGRHFQPDDRVLRPILHGGRLSPALREVVALCGASWPYRQAALVIGRLRGAPLAPETIRAVVGTLGHALVTTQATAARTACATPPRTVSGEAPVAPPTMLTVELDGGWVAAHDNAHGLEVKVGVVHAEQAVIGRTRTQLQQRQYTATAQGVERFGQLVTAAVETRNGFAAPTQTVLGDGAAWIWRLAADCFPAAIPVLDRWHLGQAQQRAVRAALPDKAARAPWYEHLTDRLDHGDVPGAITVLEQLAQIAPHPGLQEFVDYLTALAPQIPDYAARRAAGQRIGSGGIEKGVDLVVNRRLKGKRGMRWWRDRIDGVVALRLALLNNEWDDQMTAALAA